MPDAPTVFAIKNTTWELDFLARDSNQVMRRRQRIYASLISHLCVAHLRALARSAMWFFAQLGFNEYATCIFATLIMLIFIKSRKRLRTGSKLPFPPGPPRLPIIGNLHQMPSSHLWEKAAEWGKQYGKSLSSKASYAHNLI